MKASLLAALVVGGIFASLVVASALPPDLNPPPATFGDAGRDGTLLVTDDLREADFGGGLRLPVRWVYRSSDQGFNPYGWDGFSLTILEAKAVKDTDVLYKVTLLCGKVLYFNNESSGTLEWKSNDEQWTGAEDAGKFTITRWDGWQLEFQDGRIKKLTTEDSRTLNWSYDSTNPSLVTEIKETGEDPVVEVEISANPLHMEGSSSPRGAHAITVNDDEYVLKYSGGTLQEIGFPDGRKTQWALVPDGADKRLTFTDESGYWKSWKFGGGDLPLLITDDVWSYTFVSTYIPSGWSGHVSSGQSGNNGGGGDNGGGGSGNHEQPTGQENPEQPTGGENPEQPPGGETGEFGNTGNNGGETGGGETGGDEDISLPPVVYNRPTMERTRISTGEKQKVEYEASNSIEIRTDVLGNVTKSYSYKATGKLYDKTYKIERKRAGESEFTTIWRGSYDSETGDLLRSFDADDNETEYSYERFPEASEFLPPKIVTTTDPLDRETVIERDVDGNVIKVTNKAGVVRNMEWDSRRRLTRIKNSSNDVLLRLVYGDKDQVLERYDALNNETEYAYTIHLGSPLVTQITTPEGHIVEMTRDSMGRVTKIENSSGADWEYDYVGNWSVVETLTDPLNHETDFEYDTRLNEAKRTDALTQETETEYDDLDLPKEVADALNQVTKLEWNANGDVTKLTDPRNKVYTMAWESSGGRKELAWPDSVNQTVTYDAEGKVSIYQPRGTGATITNVWNTAQEISGQSWSNGGFSGTTSLTRNSLGQIDGSSTTTMTLTVSGSYGYNGQGQLSSQSQTVGGITRSASMTYDLNGSLKTITYPAGFTVEYEHNGDGQVTAIRKGETTLASYSYDSAGRLSTRTLSNGVVATYSYDGMDRVNQIAVTSGTSSLWAERYGYNAIGERIYTLKGTTGTLGDAYWLDATSQLVGVKYGATGADASYSSATSPASVSTWDYDPAGNRATQVVDSGTTSYTVNDINQYSTANSGTLTYSGRGDLATDGDWEYDYDASGNLIQAHNTNSNVLAKYWRDAFGHRAVKDVDGSKTVYFNLGTAQLEAYDVTSATTTSTIYEPGIDRPLAEISDSGAVSFYHQDWLGSVVMLTNASGAKGQTYSYDAWGDVSGFDGSGTPIADSAIASRRLYTARELDQEVGFYHYRARGYSSNLGRFIQNDPIDFWGGDSNLLRYVANNPINYWDPLGLEIQVRSSPAFGSRAIGNHAYVHSTETGESFGRMAKSTGLRPPGDGGGSASDPYNVVKDLNGMTERQFMDALKASPEMDSGPWIPGANDCHTDLEDAFKSLNVPFPGVPGGRHDFFGESSSPPSPSPYRPQVPLIEMGPPTLRIGGF